MAHRDRRGFCGFGRAPILALLAGVGFFMPAGTVSPPAAVAGPIFGTASDGAAFVPAQSLTSGTAPARLGGRGGPDAGSGSRYVPATGSAPVVATASFTPTPVPGDAALARLARCGRRSAPSTAPPAIPA